MKWSEMFLELILKSNNFVDKYGYFGIFIISLVSSLNPFVPIPYFVLLFTFGPVLNPFLLAIVAALGASIGKTLSYVIGLGGKEILEKRFNKQIKKLKKSFEKYKPEVWVFLIGLTPIIDDPVIILCGIIKYDFKKFFIALFLGKLILSLILTLAGYYSINWVLNYFDIEFLV